MAVSKKKTCKTQAKKTTARVPVKAKKPTSKTLKTKAPRKNVPKSQRANFEGATEISLTPNKIAVVRSVSDSRNGKFQQKTERKYYDKTPENMKGVQAILASGIKKITVKVK